MNSSLELPFTGSIELLQERMRKDPGSYAEEYAQYVTHFEALLSLLKVSTASVPVDTMISSINIVFNVCREVHDGVPSRLLHLVYELFHFSHQTSARLNAKSLPCLNRYPPKIIQALMQGVISLRSRKLLLSSDTIPFFLSMLSAPDKNLRRLLIRHLASDLCRGDLVGNSRSLKSMQCHVNDLIEEEDPVSSRYALLLFIDLYRRNPRWRDELSVHFISQAVFSKHSRVVKIALYFLLRRLHTLQKDITDAERKGVQTQVGSLHHSFRVRKKTRGREQKLKKSVQHVLQRAGASNDASESEQDSFSSGLPSQHDPIRMLRDPQGYAEKLFATLRRTTERFEVRLRMMQVLSRIICVHRVLLFPYYSYLQRYLEPYQRDVTLILTLAVEAVHDEIPPQELQPLCRTITSHFVHDKATPDSITIGINTLREICKRQPWSMETDVLHSLLDYVKHRQSPGVASAARSLLRFYRQTQPEMLPPKYRKRSKETVPIFPPKRYGEAAPLDQITGLDLLNASRNNAIQEQNLVEDGLEYQSNENDSFFNSEYTDHEESTGCERGSDSFQEAECEVVDSAVEDNPNSFMTESCSFQRPPHEIEEKGVLQGVKTYECSSVASTNTDALQQSTDSINSSDNSSAEYWESDTGSLPDLIPIIEQNNDEVPTPASTELLDAREVLLTSEDFSKIKKIQNTAKKGKNSIAKHVLTISDLQANDSVDPSIIEKHSNKQRTIQYEEKKSQIEEERKKHSIGYKKSLRSGSHTHGESRKRKLFSMTQRSSTVRRRQQLSQKQKDRRRGQQAKKNIKFRIRRGYKA